MKPLKLFFAIICITAGAAESNNAKSWRGIMPLHSTVADVTRRFGPCTRKTGNSCLYDFKHESVTVFYLPENCVNGLNRIPRSTVIRIERRPIIATRLPEYTKVDFAHYSAFRLQEGSSSFFETYIDGDEGFAAEVEDGAVTQAHYTATAAEINLCPASYVKPSDLLPAREGKILTEFFAPLVFVTCPKLTVEPDEPISFSASAVGGFPYIQPTYTWAVTAGRIRKGQGTLSISVNTKDLPDDTKVTATLVVGGTGKSYESQGSCTTTIRPYRVRRKE